MFNNQIKIFPRNGLSKHDYIKRHYSQNKFLKDLYDSNSYTDDELLYIFKNNTLKKLGFPMKRGGRKYKGKQYCKIFVNTTSFNILDNIINDMLTSKMEERFEDFVAFKDCNFGNPKIVITNS